MVRGMLFVFFEDRGWEVRGLDFSSAGFRNHHSELAEKVDLGAIKDDVWVAFPDHISFLSL